MRQWIGKMSSVVHLSDQSVVLDANLVNALEIVHLFWLVSIVDGVMANNLGNKIKPSSGIPTPGPSSPCKGRTLSRGQPERLVYLAVVRKAVRHSSYHCTLDEYTADSWLVAWE